VATDVVGEVLDERVPEGVESLVPDAVHAIVLDYLTALRERLPDRTLLGLGLASPGFIDPQSGTVITIGRVPNWNHLPLAQRLGDASGLPVTIGNDVDAMAAVEFGANGDPRTYAYVGFSEGVKFSMFLSGKPYVGAFGNAGLVNPRLLAACSDRPGAADVLTVHGLAERYLERAGPAGARRVRAQADARARFLAVLHLAENGDPDAAELVGWMTEMLGAQIAAFVLLLQPELLVLGGALAGASDRLLGAIDGVARRGLPTLLDNNLVVRRARAVAPNAAAVGATRVFLDRFLAADAPPLASFGA
jgi:glucokinase